MITIRPPEQGEYEQAIECIAEARGVNYYPSRYADPAYLFGGEHEVFAAYDESGEMIGITGISRAPFDTKRSMLSLLNIRPEFTGNGAAKALLKHTVDLLEARNIRCIKGQVVTRHAKVQAILERLGLSPAGVLYGVRDGSNASPVIEGKCPLIQIVRNISAQRLPPLFVHEAVAGFARMVYADLNLNPELLTRGWPGQSLIEHSYDDHDSVLWAYAGECGASLTEKLQKLVERYKSDRLTTTVLLNLNSPSAIYGYDALRGDGYKFCGLDPLGDTERAIFYKGNAEAAEMSMTERMWSFYEEVTRYE